MTTARHAPFSTDSFASRLTAAKYASGDMAVGRIADETGLAAGDIHDYLAGAKTPTLSACHTLADALDVPPVYLTRPLCEVGPVSHRKDHKLGKRVSQRIMIDIQVAFDNHYNIEDVLEVHLPDFAAEHRVSELPTTADDIDHVAREMRSVLRIDSRMLQPDVHMALDARVRLLPFAAPRTGPGLLDGCVVESDRGDRAIAFNRCAPVDRQRFTLAHELGHLIMGDGHNEMVADKFAAAFLMPRELVIDEYKRLDGQDTLDTLLTLKRKFGCSIATLNLRCRELGLIDEQSCTRNWVRLSYLGWRRLEPDGGLEVPQYRRYADLCFDGWQRGLITRSKLSELLGGAVEVDARPWYR